MKIKTARVLGTLALGGSLIGGLGCTSDEEKICDKMIELLEQEGDPLDEEHKESCVSELESKLASCANRSEVVDCYKSIEDAKAVLKCESLCRRDGSGSTGAAEPTPEN